MRRSLDYLRKKNRADTKSIEVIGKALGEAYSITERNKIIGESEVKRS